MRGFLSFKMKVRDIGIFQTAVKNVYFFAPTFFLVFIVSETSFFCMHRSQSGTHFRFYTAVVNQ